MPGNLAIRHSNFPPRHYTFMAFLELCSREASDIVTNVNENFPHV